MRQMKRDQSTLYGMMTGIRVERILASSSWLGICSCCDIFAQGKYFKC